MTTSPRFQTFFCALALMGVFWAAPPARAQQCDTLFETITTLRPPAFGFPTVWDAEYGIRDSMVQIKSGVPVEGGTVFTIGRRLSAEDFKPQEIILAELNRRGRALKEEKYPAKDGEEPVKMIRMGKEFIAISNMRGGAGKSEKWARLAWYDGQGKYRRDKILKDATFDYEAMTLAASAEKPGFVAVLRAVNRSDETDQNGVVMRFSPGGELLWRRAYRPGIPNMLNNLVPVGDSNYMAAGMIRLDDGRMAGWAMKLGYDGAVHWQRTYPRGAFSSFHDAVLSTSKTTEGKGFILSGESKPAGGGPQAAWIMAVNALGDPLWQRYYRRSDYELNGKWIAAEPDGRITIIIDSHAVEGEGGHDHARMLTLSPRGGLIQDESYYEGMQARATDYAPGWNGERIVMATIEDDMNEAQDNEESPVLVVGLAKDALPEEDAQPPAPAPQKPVYKGWVFVASALDPYPDPCATQER